MQQRGLERYAPLAGIVFVVLVILSFVIAGEPPDAQDSTAETVEYWTDKDDVNVVSAIMAAIAGVAVVWFGGSLRSVLRAVDARLAALALAGLVVVAAGAGVNASMQFAAADSAGEVPGEVTHTLSALYAYLWFPFTIGFAITLLAAGVAALRFGALPAWLGWASIVIAVVLMTPAGFIGFLASLLWVAVVSVMLFTAQNREPADASQIARDPR